MSEFSSGELEKARETLAEIGVTNRLDAGEATVLLAHLGRLLLLALIDHPANRQIREAGALYAAWRQLLDVAAYGAELPTDFLRPTDDQLERVITHLQELV